MEGPTELRCVLQMAISCSFCQNLVGMLEQKIWVF